MRDGKRNPSLVVSSVPLATDDGDGDLVPVDTALAPVAGGFAPAQPSQDLTIGDSAADPITVGDGGAVAVQALGVSDSSGVLENETIVYPNVGTDTDLAVQPTAEGVQTFHHLRSAESPEMVALGFSLPDGAALVGDPDKGLKIMKGDQEIGIVTAPVAWDADQQPVEIDTTVKGSILEIEVAHRNVEVKYPIVVDPVIQRSSHNTQIWPNTYDAFHGFTPAQWGGTSWVLAFPHSQIPRALGISAGPGYFDANNRGTWVYWAGGADARIWFAQFHGWGKPWHQNDSVYTGIWAQSRNDWERNQAQQPQVWMQSGAFDGFNPKYCPLPEYIPTWEYPNPGCIDWGGTYNNAAVFGLFMDGGGYRGAWTDTIIRGFTVAIADWHAPWSHADTTNSWTQDGQVHVAAGDNGLGVKQVRIEAPNQPQWDGAIVDTDPCDASTWQPCPRTKHYWPRLGNLPKGRNHTLRVYVTDATGNILSEPRDFLVGVAAAATDYALYREDGSAMVWVMKGGLKHWVASPDAAAAAGLDLAALQQVPAGNLASYPRGADVTIDNAHQWCVYPTSCQYGGSDRRVNHPSEARPLADVLKSEDEDAVYNALWAGLHPGDTIYMDQYFESAASDPESGDQNEGRSIFNAASDAGSVPDPSPANTLWIGSCFANPRKNGSLPVDLPSWVPGIGTVTWAHHKTVFEHRGRATTLTADNGVTAYLIMADIEMKRWVRSRAINTIVEVRTDSNVIVGGNPRTKKDKADAVSRDATRPKKMPWYAHKALWVYSGASFYWRGETRWQPIDLVAGSVGLKWRGDFVGQNLTNVNRQWLACRV